jgi:NADPH-dependent F420 reductase
MIHLSDTSSKKPIVAVIGGTGKEGGGLAYRWAHAGYPILIGSRDAERAMTAADELNEALGIATIRGLKNADAAREGEVLILSVPYSAHTSTLESIKAAAQGKILIDVSVPIMPPVTQVHIPAAGSAAQEAQNLLGDQVRVVSAFQNVSAVHLKDLSASVACDVLVTGNDADAKSVAIALSEAAGMRGIDAGVLANAVVAESLTPLLLGINKRYGVKGAGILITQLDLNRDH